MSRHRLYVQLYNLVLYIYTRTLGITLEVCKFENRIYYIGFNKYTITKKTIQIKINYNSLKLNTIIADKL